MTTPRVVSDPESGDPESDDPDPNPKTKVERKVKVKVEPRSGSARRGRQSRGKGKTVRRKLAASDKGKGKSVRRKLVAQFISRMADRRENPKKKPTSGKRVKQIARKARGLLPKTKSAGRSSGRRKRKSTDDNKPQCKKNKVQVVPFKIGDKVSAQWFGEQNHGDWFPATILGINTKKKTMSIEYDDGDKDTKVPWKSIIIPTSPLRGLTSPEIPPE